jgi:protein-tyrosine phosphatase
MFPIYANLFIGDENACFDDDREGWALVHACKSPCHQRILGYRKSLPQNHPHYLFFQKENHLYLNMIDPERPLFVPTLFVKSLDFIRAHISTRKILIHCNHGKSRSASIALLYLAKCANAISQISYRDASRDFVKLFPDYQPSRGIASYLDSQWNEF